jgi:threonine synthase
VFCEPSSAASVAGVAKAAAGGAILADELVVAVLTGNGLKDPETAEKVVAGRIVESDATEDGVMRALGW